MSLLLNVPYAEKDEAKQLGAKWDANLKKWYVSEKKDYHKFFRWTLGDRANAEIICDHFYIIEGNKECSKCNHETKVILFGLENWLEMEMNFDDYPLSYEWFEGEINTCSKINPLPDMFKDYIIKRYNYAFNYAKNYAKNRCMKCNTIQHVSDHHQDSPFYLISEERVRKLILYKIKLSNDFVAINTDIRYGGSGWLKEFAKIIDLDIYLGF